jgi:hypothetical protein
MRIYYTYKWLREDGTPYYIGKGKGNRAWAIHKRKNVSYYPPEGRVEIIMKGLTEDEALLHEVWLIALYKRKCEGGLLINIAAGGQGPSNAKWTLTDLTKQRMKVARAKRPPASAETCKKISEAQKRRARSPHSDITKLKMSESALNPEAQPAHKKAAQSRAVSATNAKKQPCPQCGMLMNVGNLTKHLKGTRCPGNLYVG